MSATASSVLPAGDAGYEVHIGNADPLGLVLKLVSEGHAKNWIGKQL